MPLEKFPGLSGVFQVFCGLSFHPLSWGGRGVLAGGSLRPCPCLGGPGDRLPFLSGMSGPVALLGALSVPLDGFRPLFGLPARMDAPIHELFRLPAYFLKGRRAGLFHQVHRLGVRGGVLSGPFLFCQLLSEFSSHLAADVPHRPSAAFSLDLVAGVPFPWFRHDCHLPFVSHGEIYFSTRFSTSAIPAIM